MTAFCFEYSLWNLRERPLQPPPGPDFSVPPSTSLLPPRPPIAAPANPSPSRPTEVSDDFSKCKPPQQVPIGTYYASIEPWIRGIKEEDIGFLEWTADETEPYIVPKLGRHYTEVWEEEDMRLYGGPLPGGAPGRSGAGRNEDGHVSTVAPQPKWDPSTLTEPDLVTEERGHGPLTERLISALLPMPDSTVWKGVKAAEDAMEGRPGGGGGAAARREKMNVGDLEERIRDTMRFHGLLDKAVRFFSPVFVCFAET
jgi:transcriptional adapter 3